ncbi:MAG: DUF2442 domain-containing protein [Coriobacteriales bacterium]|jgi:hypothetical protein|nr:DUF2442 domain-containing protein [Coriobacteriales bacterium]
MEFKHPISVEALRGSQLMLAYEDDERRLFDVSPYLSHPYYAGLEDPAVFDTAHIAHGTVAWFGNIDIAPDDLYFNSIGLKGDKI